MFREEFNKIEIILHRINEMQRKCRIGNFKRQIKRHLREARKIFECLFHGNWILSLKKCATIDMAWVGRGISNFIEFVGRFWANSCQEGRNFVENRTQNPFDTPQISQYNSSTSFNVVSFSAVVVGREFSSIIQFYYTTEPFSRA